jgi:hypothetical protein
MFGGAAPQPKVAPKAASAMFGDSDNEDGGDLFGSKPKAAPSSAPEATAATSAGKFLCLRFLPLIYFYYLASGPVKPFGGVSMFGGAGMPQPKAAPKAAVPKSSLFNADDSDHEGGGDLFGAKPAAKTAKTAAPKANLSNPLFGDTEDNLFNAGPSKLKASDVAAETEKQAQKEREAQVAAQQAAAQAAAEAKSRAEAEKQARAKADSEAKAKADSEAKAKADSEAKAKADAIAAQPSAAARRVSRCDMGGCYYHVVFNCKGK